MPPSDPASHNPWWPAAGSDSCSTRDRSVRLPLTSVAANPAAMHPLAVTHEIVARYPKAVTLGLGSTDQAKPFHSSMNGAGSRPPLPVAAPEAPTAQQLDGPRQVTSVSRSCGPAGLGLDATDQSEPFQRSTSVAEGLPSAPMVAPTDQHAAEETQVTLPR